MPPGTSTNRGRLELTWTNKDKALLPHEDGTYEWLPPKDHRVAEVRLLRDAGTVGDVRPDEQRAKDNLLIRGDALYGLASLAALPEFNDEYVGKVALAYLDPPFNTQQSFAHYDDALEHSVWLTMMRDRLEQVERLLAPTGSAWVHCDDYEQHRLRAVMDEVFGPENFVATIVWQKLYARKSNTPVSSSHDFIHVYASDLRRFRRNLQPPTPAQLARYKNPDADPRGPWQSVSFSVRTDDPGRRGEYRYPIALPSGRTVRPPAGRHWNGKRDRYERLLAEGRLWFGRDGDSLPRLKDFLRPEEVGLVPITWWPRTEVGDNDESKSEIQALFPEIGDPFQTPKPERLLQRIVHVASNPGDIVLDCFLGSGTTAAVAHKMARRWVGVEWSRSTLDDYAAPRLAKVVAGEDPGGVTEAVGWRGGGGFRVVDVAPSLYATEDSAVYLAEWATNGALSEAVAAQLGFAYEPDPPFSGRRGRVRLAVLDGHATEAIARDLAGQLAPGERLGLWATSLDPAVPALLAKLRSGSAARAIPEDVLLAYATPQAWRAAVARPAPDDEAPPEAADAGDAPLAAEAAGA